MLLQVGGMLFQQADTLRLIGLAHTHGKPIAVGEPDATSSPHMYAAADFWVLGEAEGIIDKFIAAWEAGARTGLFEAPRQQCANPRASASLPGRRSVKRHMNRYPQPPGSTPLNNGINLSFAT